MGSTFFVVGPAAQCRSLCQPARFFGIFFSFFFFSLFLSFFFFVSFFFFFFLSCRSLCQPARFFNIFVSLFFFFDLFLFLSFPFPSVPFPPHPVLFLPSLSPLLSPPFSLSPSLPPSFCYVYGCDVWNFICGSPYAKSWTCSCFCCDSGLYM